MRPSRCRRSSPPYGVAWLLGRPDIGSLAWPLTGAMASLGFLVLDMVQVRLPAPPSDDG